MIEDIGTEIIIVSGTEEIGIIRIGSDQGLEKENTIGKRVIIEDTRLQVLNRQAIRITNTVPKSNHSLIMTVKKRLKPNARKRKMRRL